MQKDQFIIFFIKYVRVVSRHDDHRVILQRGDKARGQHQHDTRPQNACKAMQTAVHPGFGHKINARSRTTRN